MRKFVFGIMILLLIGSTLTLLAQHPREGKGTKITAKQQSQHVKDFGTVAYDPGAPQDSFRGFSGTNQSVGNIFSSANGSPLQTGTVTAVTVFPIAVGSDVIVTLYGPPTGGGNAANLGFFTVFGMVNSTFNVANLTVPVGPTFLAGIYIGTFGSGPDSIGMRSVSANGQGFHAMQVDFGNSTSASNFTLISGQNAMVRASGDILTPVELLNFSLE